MILGLDGLRAIAFLLIFGFHTKYIQFGWVGVQLFFVLSGFLITFIPASLTYRFIEIPFLQLKDKFFPVGR